MKKPLVECVANYSEGRRLEVVEAIAQAIQSVPQVIILDRHSDPDHNRSVITFVGPPEQVEEAAFQSIAKAAQLINLDEHRGEHPRIGATDVVPFVPIRGVTMQDCVAMAQRLGQRVAQTLNIPVYLYEEAATRPERKNLENIRRGEYETLKTAIQTDPERRPDFGPCALGPAGATVIGARQPLIAFNVYLTTDDLSIARQIARAARHSSGGLRYVKALEMMVDGRAQVSMNLTNYHQTPLARVVELIRREAQRYGVMIHHSELVGLIPQEAITQAAIWYLQLDEFQPDQILEQRLAEALAAGESEAEAVSEATPEPGQRFLDELAAGTPTPGGGSAAAYAAAQAAALVAMVARLTLGKKKYAAHQAQMEMVLAQAEQLRRELYAAVAQDAAAFEQVLAALRLPKDTPAEQQARQNALDQATLAALRLPLQTAQNALQVMELAEVVTRLGNLNAISDGGVAAMLARAALTGAGLNVRINANALSQPELAQPELAALAQLEAQASKLDAVIRQTLAERGGIHL